MSNFATVIEQCQNATGAGSKKIIQEALGKADATARTLITYALDPYITFGLKNFEMPTVSAKTMDTQHDYAPFIALLEDLRSRKLSGDAARAAVTKALIPFNKRMQDMLARVLDKDLRGGFSADSVNKAMKANPIPGDMGRKLVPTFEVMLADKCEDTEEFEAKVTFPCQADWKYDGQRTIMLIREGQPVEYRARSGKESEHLNGLFDAEAQALRAHLGCDIVVDGEAFASDFTETINAKKAGNDAAKAALKLRAFFVMPLTDWIAQSTKITMRESRTVLIKALGDIDAKKIIVSAGKEVQNYEEMTEYCNHVIDVEKQEGLILKRWDAVYQWDRSIDWCKVKRFYDVDCKIVGFYLGKKGKKFEKTLGGIKVWGRTEDGTIVESDVGSGFGSLTVPRETIWDNQADWLGATVVIKYQEVSKSKNKAVASLRFPTFSHRRDDKVVE